jgi:hypothetical protein
MINKQQQQKIEELWTESDSVNLSPAARLDKKIEAFLTAMRTILRAAGDVQMFWDNADLLALMLAAGEGEPLDPGGTVTKESVLEYQILFLSFQHWLDQNVEADVLGTVQTLDKTARQLIMRQPEKVAQTSNMI